MEDNLFIGRCITANDDLLQPIAINDICHQLREPKAEVMDLIQQLNTIRTVNMQSYACTKKRLPYIVCATFKPAYRKKENFAHTQYFIVDIDHISDKQMDINTLRQTLQQDMRVAMSFVSPSQDGLKLLFKLKERCYDSGLYSVFYKKFVQQFAEQYNLQQVVDAKTCDVRRACFMSYDPQAHINILCEPIDINAYADMSQSYMLLEEKRELESQIVKSEQDIKPAKDPDSDTIKRIKEILSLKRVEIVKPPVFVPEQLNQIMPLLTTQIEATGLTMGNITDIQYGKQVNVSLGMRQGECNIYFGKRGYKVVKSTKSGTDSELNDLLHDLIMTLIFDIIYAPKETQG